MATSSISHGPFIRLGGVACLVGLGIHVAVNEGVKVMPPADLPAADLQRYLTEQAEAWALVHGLRNLALPALALFAAAAFVRTCCLRATSATGWGVLGLLGTAMLVVNAFVTNAIETALLVETGPFASDPGRFYALFRITRVLFTAEIATWAVLIGGFSVAGRVSRTLPAWLSALGGLSAVCGLLSGAFVVSVLEEGRAVLLIEVAALSGLLWFACTAVWLILRGSKLDDGATPRPEASA